MHRVISNIILYFEKIHETMFNIFFNVITSRDMEYNFSLSLSHYKDSYDTHTHAHCTRRKRTLPIFCSNGKFKWCARVQREIKAARARGPRFARARALVNARTSTALSHAQSATSAEREEAGMVIHSAEASNMSVCGTVR